MRGSLPGIAWTIAVLVAVVLINLYGDSAEDEAAGRMTCAYEGAPMRVLTVEVIGSWLGSIVRRGKAIEARGEDDAPTTCAGGAPTVTNTDTIKVVLQEVSFVDIDLSGGPFAPGATRESEGASEIEIEVSGDIGGAEIYGTEAADVWHWGPGGRTAGLNLNPRTRGDTDVDVTQVADGDLADGLSANGAGGDDTIVGAPGARVRGTVDAAGDAGDDVLSAPRFIATGLEPAFAELSGGAGDDVLTGAATDDFLEGGAGADRIDGRDGDDEIKGGPGRDRLMGGHGADTIGARDSASDIVSCGAGRDRVTRDPRDEVSGCERGGAR